MYGQAEGPARIDTSYGSVTTAQAVRDRTHLEVIEERLSKHVQSLKEVAERLAQVTERLSGSGPLPNGQSTGVASAAVPPAGRVGSLGLLLDEAESVGSFIHNKALHLSETV